MTLNTVIVELPHAGSVYSKSHFLGFYWCDSFSTREFGPFKSVYDAMKDYTRVLDQRKITAAQTAGMTFIGLGKSLNILGDIIMVDFKNKKRIS